MRIGTWNLAGRWTDEHADLLVAMDCDVLLLTEVHERLSLDGYFAQATAGFMLANRRWGAVLARSDLQPLPDPHFASASALVNGIQFVSSILPWRTCGASWPGHNTHARTVLALESIVGSATGLPLVWGGDWNHALSGPERSGSLAGRTDILRTVADFGLQVPTAKLAHRIADCLTIDHLAVPTAWGATSAQQIVASSGVNKRLSDHDAYVVDVKTITCSDS